MLFQASQLSTRLVHTQLPGLTSLDQMYLMALADTVASTKTDGRSQLQTEAFVTDGQLIFMYCFLYPN